jgi:hypothetical protein
MERTRVIDKVQKLLRLSKSSNQFEAAQAAAFAAALMARFEIDEATELADNAGVDEPVEDDVPLATWGKSRVAWKGLVAGGFAKANGVKVWWEGGTMKAIGRRSDIQSCAYLASLVCREVERLAEEGARTVNPYHVRRWKNSFRIGAATIIRERLTLEAANRRTAQRARAGEWSNVSTQALMVINRREEATDRLYRQHRFTSLRGPSVGSSSGYSAGRSAGANVRFGGRAVGALGSAQGQVR